MSEQRVSGRYAKSLVDLAVEKQQLDKVYADMLAFKTTVEQNPSLANLLKSPVVNPDKKQAILKSVFGKAFTELTLLFLATVTAKKREYFLHDIAVAFIAQYNEINRITDARIKTATAISADALAEVKTFLEKQTGKKVNLEASTDASLIGGLIVQIEDRLYDASISGKLKKAKQELLNTYISK